MMSNPNYKKSEGNLKNLDLSDKSNINIINPDFNPVLRRKSIKFIYKL